MANMRRVGWISRLPARRAYHFDTTASVLPNTVNRQDPDFIENAQNMDSLTAKLKDLFKNHVEPGGPERARQKHLAAGKLLPRQRLDRLLDPKSPFLELSQHAGHELYKEPFPAGALITGIGQVSGVKCMIIINDPTVKGGSYSPITIKKHLRAQEIARQNRLPCIYISESGGASLPQQADVFPDRDHFGRMFYNEAQMSAEGIPQIAVAAGMNTAGGAYTPAMADETIIVRNQGTIFLAGPPLVKAATGEETDAESLGGGLMHSTESGVTDHLAINDEHALVLVRQAVANLNYKPSPLAFKPEEFEEPLYDPQDLHGIVSTDVRRPFVMKDVISRLVDGSKMHEFKKEYGTSIITGFAKIHGFPVGIIANNGVLFSNSSLKATHFIQLCEQRNIPLLFLANISGFMVGSAAEKGGIAKDGAKMIRAVATTKVPKFTVACGGSYGAGNYGMCGRAFSPNLLFTWPNARIAIMGSQQLSTVMSTVSSKASAESTAQLAAKIEHESQAMYGSARLWDDGILLPTETRSALALGLAVAAESGWENRPGRGQFGIFRM